MTPEENEEFNRIEMESHIKQEYVRDIQKQMDELALARMLVRELGDRLAKLEKPWVRLTDEEMHECWGDPLTPLGMKCARAIEAKLKEKNT